MGSGKFAVDHDRFVMKNRAMATAYEMERKDRSMEEKGFSHIQRQKEPSCFNCKLKPKCIEFRSRRSGSTSGVVSYGGDEKIVCKKYVPAPAENRAMSDKQIKSLLKNIKRMY
jgi:hypothetical protein